MYAQHSCIFHENKELVKVCIESHCKDNKLLCEECIKEQRVHDIHTKVDFDKFFKTWQKVHLLNHQTKFMFVNKFNKIKEKFGLYLRSVEAKFMEAVNCENLIAKFDDLQIQQIYGEAERQIKDSNIQQILLGGTFEQVSKKRKVEEEFLEKKLSQFEGDILMLMNNLLNDIKKSQVNLPKSIINVQAQIHPKMEQKIYHHQQKKESRQFSFCQQLKSKWLQIGSKGKTIFRPSDHKNGLTVYGIVQQPLSAHTPSITLKVEHQGGGRYIYIGVCQLESFKKLNFEGRVYEMGREMYAIRQNQREKHSAVSLHSSLKQYSNRERVGWDFKQGDEIRLELRLAEEVLRFVWNDHVFFEMPLDSHAKLYYPFVGIKMKGGEVRIVQKNMQKNVQKEEGGIFNFFGLK